MEIRPLAASDLEAARQLLLDAGFGGERLADGERFAQLIARSQRALVKAILGNDSGIGWVLRTSDPGAVALYEKLGFVRSTLAMERPGAR